MRKSTLIFAMFGLCLAAPEGRAQAVARGLSAGLQGAYNFNDLNRPALGAHLVVALPVGLALSSLYETYFLSTGSLWRLSATLRWAPPAAVVAPYFGAGPTLSRSAIGGTTGTTLGALAQLGVETRLGAFQPFVELEVVDDGAVSSEFLAGLRVVMSGRH